MLEGYFFNPAVQGAAPALIQTLGTLLFCAVFLFLWRHSGVVYFGFWSLAWAIESLALISGFVANRSGLTVFTWIEALLEFLFALSLLAAARSAATPTARGFGASFKSLLLFPGLPLLVYVFMWRLPPAQFHGLHAAILASIYGYSFVRIGLGSSLQRGIGAKLLRFTLACLFVEYLLHAGASLLARNGVYELGIYELMTQTLLAFSAMAMWIQTQQDAIAEMRGELKAMEKAGARSAELDHLTGLQNRTALDRHLEENFTGVVAVCDLDYFKGVNDRFGHLVGDEVLRHVGNLIRGSIRLEDEAFRWGGDEFVLLFRQQHLELAQNRMAAMELRLMTFRLRGYGLFPLGLSWGAAEGVDAPLRPILEEADLQMYGNKRHAHAKDA